MENLGGLNAKLKPLTYLDVEIKTPHQKCQHCDKIKDDVELLIEPYGHEIHGNLDWHFMCQDCYGEACADI